MCERERECDESAKCLSVCPTAHTYHISLDVLNINLYSHSGSEKWKPMRDKDLSEEHVTELTNINLSLHTLGRCISALASRSSLFSMHSFTLRKHI